MKRQLNEVKKLQKIAGLLKEEENLESSRIESKLMSTIKGQSNDMSFLRGVSDQEFVAALEKLGEDYEVEDSDMGTQYYIGEEGDGIIFVNDEGNWRAGDWHVA